MHYVKGLLSTGKRYLATLRDSESLATVAEIVVGLIEPIFSRRIKNV